MTTLYPEFMESLTDEGLEKQASKATELLKRYKHLLRGGHVKDLKAFLAVNLPVGIPSMIQRAKREKLKVLLARLGTGAVPVGAGAVVEQV